MDNGTESINNANQPHVQNVIAEQADPIPKRNNTFFKVIIIAGMIEAILPTITVFAILPQMAPLYSGLTNSSYNPIPEYVCFGIILFVSVMQILYGILQLRKNLANSSKNMKIATVFFTIGVIASIILIPLMLLSIISPIYHVLGTS